MYFVIVISIPRIFYLIHHCRWLRQGKGVFEFICGFAYFHVHFSKSLNPDDAIQGSKKCHEVIYEQDLMEK